MHLVPFLSIQIIIRKAILKTSDVPKLTKNICEDKKREAGIRGSL